MPASLSFWTSCGLTAVQLGHVVRRAARGGQQLELLGRRPRLDRSGRCAGAVDGSFLAIGCLELADVDAERALAARDAVDGGTRDEVAIEQ